MATTSADVVRIAPEFAEVALDEIEAAIADAAVQLNPKVWGTRYDLGVRYLAAHIVAQAYPVKVRNEVSSESIQGVSRSLAQSDTPGTGADRFHNEYLRLLRTVGATFTTDYGVDPQW